MIFPAVTAFYGGLLGLIFVVLSGLVVFGRGKFRVVHGDGGHDLLHKLIRSHANFAEYVPLILVLTALLEAGGGSPGTIRTLLVILVIARVAHPIGMVAREMSLQQSLFRGVSAAVTWIILIIVSVLLLIR
jgi:uncharacterized membrane protein YecN with MAPEG domain